jgi:hypothetical protein
VRLKLRNAGERMNKFLRLAATATLSGLVAFMVTAQGCSGEGGKGDGGIVDPGTKCTDPNDYTTCECDVKSDCTPNDPSKAKFFVCTPRHACVKICFAKTDCATDELCEDSQCRKPACADDAECGNASLQCVGGACVAKIPATEVDKCSVQPATALLHSDATKTFYVVATNAAGKVIPYHGDVTWTADAAVGTVAAVTGSPFQANLTGAATAGSGKLGATVGGKACTDASITNFAAVASGTTRVVVASFADQTPVKEAKVVVGAETYTTDANGVATFPTPDGQVDISVFANGFSYVTMIDVKTNDVVAFVKPSFKPGKLKGEFTARSFDKLQDVKGTVHLAISGASIAGNVLDLSLTTLLGESVKTKIDLGGSANVEAPLPDGIAIGLAENMFKGKYSIQSAPGFRTGWSLGGNVVLSDVLGVVSQATGGGDIDIGAILSALLPVLGRLQAGSFAGLEFKPETEGNLPADFGPTTLLRLQSKVKVPKLTKYVVNGEDKFFEGAIVLAGALYGPEGLVPSGLSAGVDKDNDGFTDAVTGTAASDKGYLNLRFAPQSGGVEGSKTVALSLAASFSGLLSDSGENGPLVLSGRVAFPNNIKFATNSSNEINLGAEYLAVPTDVALDEGTRTLTISGLAGADLFRLDLGKDDQEWQVYFDGTSSAVSITVPAVPQGFTDRFVGTEAGKLPGATLQSVSLKGKDGLNYQNVIGFSSDNTNDLTAAIDAFSARGIDRVVPVEK